MDGWMCQDPSLRHDIVRVHLLRRVRPRGLWLRPLSKPGLSLAASSSIATSASITMSSRWLEVLRSLIASPETLAMQGSVCLVAMVDVSALRTAERVSVFLQAHSVPEHLNQDINFVIHQGQWDYGDFWDFPKQDICHQSS